MNIKYLVFSILISSLYSQDEDLDSDVIWESVVWIEIIDIPKTTVYEVEYITATAGVRGAEAEDEALQHLYYRRSMKGISKIELQKALGKLILKKEVLEQNNQDTQKIDSYIIQLKYKLS